MTKKDYIVIARVLNFVLFKSKKTKEKAMIRFITNELIKTFQNDNKKFNSVKFLTAIYNEN